MSSSTVVPPKKPPVTIGDAKLKSIQYCIGLATIVVPLVATIYAIALALSTGLGAVEVTLMLVMYVLTTLGIEFCFHRSLSHKAFKIHPRLRTLFAIFGTMAGQGPVLPWVATHRRHHIYTDTPNDPHSPYARVESGKPEQFTGVRGFVHSHLTWLMTDDITNCTLFAKDIERDPILSKINTFYLPIVFAGIAIPAVIGGVVEGSLMGVLKGLLWGGFVRMFIVDHCTLSNGSFAHLFGTRPFETGDHSTNSLLFAIPTFGTAWHNNHHAFPDCAYTGLKWWQIDIAGGFIRLLAALGLVRDVKKATPQMVREKIQQDSLVRKLSEK